MAQKINPTSFRLGTNQIWDSSLQIYGKSYNFYFTNFHKFLQIKNFLYRFFNFFNFLLIQEEIKISKNKLFLKIYYSYLPNSKKLKNHVFISKISNIIFQ